MAAEHPYQYRPLTRRKEIRLLQVLPDSPTAEIKCKFKTSILRKQPWMPRYTAISYTWGSATRDESILLDGHSYLVTTSAFEVLQRIRRKDKPFLIWIDAICINQYDNEEKSRQIRLMGQIYSMASETVGWIGKTEGDSTLAISAMRSIVREFGLAHPCHYDAVLGDKILSYARSETGSREWKAITRLFSRAWFRRIWVLQEVVLSKSLVIYCGDDEFPWENVIQFLILPLKEVSKHQLGLLECIGPVGSMIVMRMSRQAETSLMGSEVAAIEPTLSQLNPVVKYLVHIIAARSTVGKEYYTTSRSLTKLLPHCSNFQATDERDQIFGLLGIAVDASDFIPDYNLSVQDVYVDITKHIIKRTKSLAILQMAGIGMTKRRPDLPSWAPDFAFLHHGPATQDKKIGFKAGIYHFKDPGAAYQIFGYKISLQGTIVDNIDHLGTLTFKQNGGWYQWLTEATNLATAVYPANSNRSEILWRTLMGNHVSVPGGSTYPATPEYGTAFTHFHTIYLKPVLRGLSFEQASAHVENDSTILPAHQQQAEIYAEQLWGTIEHRRFATTSRKAFALVHPNAKQGDLVCIFLGAEVPFVIRRKDSGSGSGNEEFELVGQCYVHGLMEGQGLQLGGVKHITLV